MAVPIAICYDFDKTLSPDDMQAQGLIQSLGWKVDDFWKATDGFAEQYEMDFNLAYMLMLKSEAEKKGEPLTNGSLNSFGAGLKLFDGVQGWFSRINEFAASMGVEVEHYVISSGLSEIIEGTPIAKEFRRIYGCSYFYDEEGFARWPVQVVNYTNKTQFLFRIEKGVFRMNDPKVNDSVPEGKKHIPFTRFIYIGDSETDVPCMAIVNGSGGSSIGVYNPVTNNKARVHKMIKDSRIRYFAPADYRDGSELDVLVKNIIRKIAADITLENAYKQNLKELL